MLLTTSRALAMAPGLAERAGGRLLDRGRAASTSSPGELLDDVDGELLVALGGGRVIDTAKALAAAREPGARPARRGGADDAVGAPR